MGNSCCRAESPCGSAEERSVLLKNDSKTTVTSGDTAVVGTCGPEGDDDIRKTPSEDKVKGEVKSEAVLLKQNAEAAEKELSHTQENGPLQREATQTAAAAPSSPRKESELRETSTRAQDEDAKKEDKPPKLQPCTLISPLKEIATSDLEAPSAANAGTEEENRASAQNKVPDSRPITASEAFPENHAETTEHSKLDTTADTDAEKGSKVTIDDAAAEPPGEISQKNNVPKTELSAADLLVSSVSVVGQEVNREDQEESPNRAVTEDPQSSPVSRDAEPEDTESHAASESSPGPEPSGLDHSEDLESSNSAREPETTALTESRESLKSDQDLNPDLDLKEVMTLERVQQEIAEDIILKEKGKDEDDPEVKEEEEIKEEVDTTEQKETEVQEVSEEEEQLTGSTSAEVKEEETMRPEKEEASSEDGLGNSDEDLYRGAEELPASQKNKPESTFLKLEDRSSLAPAVDILSYSEREWKGNTAKSALIRKVCALVRRRLPH